MKRVATLTHAEAMRTGFHMALACCARLELGRITQEQLRRVTYIIGTPWNMTFVVDGCSRWIRIHLA